MTKITAAESLACYLLYKIIGKFCICLVSSGPESLVLSRNQGMIFKPGFDGGRKLIVYFPECLAIWLSTELFQELRVVYFLALSLEMIFSSSFPLDMKDHNSAKHVWEGLAKNGLASPSHLDICMSPL